MQSAWRPGVKHFPYYWPTATGGVRHKKASYEKLSFFHQLEQAVEKTVDIPVILDSFTLLCYITEKWTDRPMSQKIHNAPDKYPTMRILKCIMQLSHNASYCNRNVHTCAHYKIEMCTCVHISVTKWCIVRDAF